MRHYRRSGNVKPKAHGGGIAAKITTEQLSIIEQLWKQQNDALLCELCERFEQRTGVTVSIATMHRAVVRLGLSTKKNIQRHRTSKSACRADAL